MGLTLLKIADLKPHPRNTEFFNDITDPDEWKEFVESIRESNGPICPITVTENNVIVSGHQRVRACKELGIETIAAEKKDYHGDELCVEKDLIETNVRQRGIIVTPPRKTKARVDALKEYYGIRKGGNDQVVAGRNGTAGEGIGLSDVVVLAGTNINAYKRAQVACSCIPEWQEALDANQVSSKTLREVVSRLSEDDQLALYNAVPKDDKITQRKLVEYAAQLASKEAENEKLRADKEALQEEVVTQKRANISQTDSAEYLKMKRERDEAIEKERASYETQQKRINNLDTSLKVTKAALKRSEKEADELRGQAEESANRAHRLERQLADLQNAEPQTVEVERVVEVEPSDYAELKQKAEQYDKLCAAADSNHGSGDRSKVYRDENGDQLSPDDGLGEDIITSLRAYSARMKEFRNHTDFLHLTYAKTETVKAWLDDVMEVAAELKDVLDT